MSRLSKHTYFLFFCVLLIFCFSQTSAAQSGRRVDKKDASPQPTPPVESKSAKTEKETTKETDKEIPMNETAMKISSLIVIGEVQHNFTYYKSNEIDAALKECVRVLQSSKSLTQVTKGGGKISYKQAKEQALEEAETYVLWLGFWAKDDGDGNVYIDSVQYAVLTPKTGKILTRGEIDPARAGVVSTGGVLNIPKIDRRTYALEQMKYSARQIAGILLRGGWLK
jgi:hypothetical protein